MTSDEIELLKLQNQYLEETLRLLICELTRAGMAEYTPSHVEMLELGNWAFGLFPLLGLDDK